MKNMYIIKNNSSIILNNGDKKNMNFVKQFMNNRA